MSVERELLWVDPESVVVPDHLLRSLDPDKLDLSDIMPSIEAKGILQPLLGRPSPEDPGRIELVVGYRRLMASRRLGLDSIPFQVAEMDDVEASMAELAENIARKDLPPHREAEATIRLLAWRMKVGEEEAVSAVYRYINSRKGLTSNALSEEEEKALEEVFNHIGRKPSYFVTHILPATKWPKPILEAVEEGVLTRQGARQLKRIEKEDLLKEAIERVREGESPSEVVSEVLGGASQGKQVASIQAKADEIEGWPMDEEGYIVPPPPTAIPEATNFEALERPYLTREIIAVLGWEKSPVALLHPDADDVQRALEMGCRLLWVDSSKPSEQGHRLGEVELPERVIAFARLREDRAEKWGDPNENDPTSSAVPLDVAVEYYNQFPVVVTKLEFAHLFGRRIEFVAVQPNMMVLAGIM